MTGSSPLLFNQLAGCAGVLLPPSHHEAGLAIPCVCYSRQRKSAVPGLWGICEVFEFMYRRYRVYFASGTCTVAFGDGKKNQGILGNRLNGRAEAATKNQKKNSVPRVYGQVPWQRGMALIDSSSKGLTSIASS